MWTKKKAFLAVIISSVLSYSIIFKSDQIEDVDVIEDVIEDKKEDEPKNYFKDISGKLKGNRGLLINTTGCKIPDFDVYDVDVLPAIKDLKAEVDQCREGKFNWTFVQEDKLVINLKQMDLDGYPFNPRFCCYKVIERVTMENIGIDSVRDMEMDKQFRYSSDCKSLNKEKTLLFNSEFIVVECGYSGFLKFFFDFPLVYRAFHASAFFSLPVPTAGESENTKSSRIKRKLEHWSKQHNENAVPPPNILIVGLDSTTRLNFRRKMPQTLKVLESLGATEMKGFIKVGENTFPNIVPMMTGYSEDDLQQLCNCSERNRSNPFDPCPFIWKSFSDANYLTAISEDSPVYANFNYKKAGFHQQPTDFLLRPLMLAGLYYDNDNKDRSVNPIRLGPNDLTNCMGHQTNDELIISYLDSILTLGRKKRTPVFSLSWATTSSHDNLNNIQLSDKVYANFISSLKDSGILDNTILFFMGDHGYRFGLFRQTLLGFYEDRLPLLWIKLPPRIEKEFPEWKHALEINSRRPTSFYTFYWTLSLILKTFSSSTKILSDPIPRKINLKDQTFFHVRHEDSNKSSCDRLGIPPLFCPCNVLKEMSTNDSTARRTALLAIKSINGRLVNSNCSQLELGRVAAAAKNEDNLDSNIEHLIISFLTSPGNYQFEVEATYFKGNKSFTEISPVQRTSKTTWALIKCNTDPGLELLCYCG